MRYAALPSFPEHPQEILRERPSQASISAWTSTCGFSCSSVLTDELNSIRDSSLPSGAFQSMLAWRTIEKLSKYFYLGNLHGISWPPCCGLLSTQSFPFCSC